MRTTWSLQSVLVVFLLVLGFGSWVALNLLWLHLPPLSSRECLMLKANINAKLRKKWMLVFLADSVVVVLGLFCITSQEWLLWRTCCVSVQNATRCVAQSLVCKNNRNGDVSIYELCGVVGGNGLKPIENKQSDSAKVSIALRWTVFVASWRASHLRVMIWTRPFRVRKMGQTSTAIKGALKRGIAGTCSFKVVKLSPHSLEKWCYVKGTGVVAFWSYIYQEKRTWHVIWHSSCFPFVKCP